MRPIDWHKVLDTVVPLVVSLIGLLCLVLLFIGAIFGKGPTA